MSVPNPITQLTPQNIQNLSFDKTFNVLAFEMLGYYPSGNSLQRIQVDANGKLAISVGGFTQGSVIFANTDGTLTQDNANLFWDDTLNRLGVGTATPGSSIDIVRSHTGSPAAALSGISVSLTNTAVGSGRFINAGIFQITDTVTSGWSSITDSAIQATAIMSQPGTAQVIGTAVKAVAYGGGTNYGVYSVTDSNANATTSGTNIAGYFSAGNGTAANYALVIPAGGGTAGFGTITPIHKIDGRSGASLRLDALAAPTASTAALAGAGAGNLTNGAYIYKVTYVTAIGETTGGTSSNTVTVTDATTNGQINLTAIPVSAELMVTSRKIYRTVAGGSTFLLLTTIANNTATTFTDNVADASLGAAVQLQNTTGSSIWNVSSKYVQLTSGGSVTMGLSTTNAGTSARLMVENTTTVSGIMSIGTAALGAGSGGGFIAVTNVLPDAANRRIGSLSYGLHDGTNYLTPAGIQASSSEAWVVGTNRGAYLSFYTTATGSAGITEKLRLSPEGKVGLMTATPYAQFSSIAKNGYHISSTDADSGGYIDTGGTSALYLTGGAQYSSGATTFTAKTTTASTIELESGTIRFYTDTSLVAGNTYTATERARFTSAGLFGIGLTPTALLHVAAGTTAASTAPMKFTTGTLMTTAEIGAVEYNGNHYRTTAGIVRYSLGGTIFDHFTDGASSHTDGTFDDLYTDTTIANTFKVDGDKIRAEYSGIFVAHATATRNVKVLFAGSTIFDSGALATTTAESWQARVTLVRVSSTSVRCVVSFMASTSAGANAFSDITYTLLTGLTLSGTNIVKVTGAAAGVGAAASDIVAKIGSVRFYGAV